MHAYGWTTGGLFTIFVMVPAFISCEPRQGSHGASGKATSEQGQEVVVAVDFPMTGNLAYYGEIVSRGATLAIDDYNRIRSEREPKIKLKIEDNYGKVAEAVKVFNKVVEQDDAVAVLSLFTPHSVALLPYSAKQRVLLYATVTSVVEFGVKSPFAFRDYISLPGQGEAMGEYLRHRAKVTTVGSLVVNDDYGLDSLRLCREAFEKLGGTWGVQEVFEQKDIDIRDPAAKVVATKPDAIYIAGRELSLANAIRQTRELGFAGLIVSNNGFDTPTVFKVVSDAGKDVVFTSSGFDPGNPESDEQASFVKRYRERFAQDPDYNASHGYTIGQALTRAIAEVGADTEKLRAFLQRYDTADMLGRAKMTESRDVSRPVALYRFDGKQRQRISPK